MQRCKGLSLKTVSQFSCSVAVHCTSAVRVMHQIDTHCACVSDVKVHLRELRTTQSCVASERQLILARVGLFDEEDMVIFPKHLALLGVKYCRSRKCLHPPHGRLKGKASSWGVENVERDKGNVGRFGSRTRRLR